MNATEYVDQLNREHGNTWLGRDKNIAYAMEQYATMLHKTLIETLGNEANDNLELNKKVAYLNTVIENMQKEYDDLLLMPEDKKSNKRFNNQITILPLDGAMPE